MQKDTEAQNKETASRSGGSLETAVMQASDYVSNEDELTYFLHTSNLYKMNLSENRRDTAAEQHMLASARNKVKNYVH